MNKIDKLFKQNIKKGNKIPFLYFNNKEYKPEQ